MADNKHLTVTLRLRVSSADVHYAASLASGAFVLKLFGDAATELLIRMDQTEGLFRAYEKIDFLAPVMAGDFLEIVATLVSKGNRSRKIQFKAYKVIAASPSNDDPHHARIIHPPQIVAEAVGTCIIPK